jgi:hypothetical protein
MALALVFAKKGRILPPANGRFFTITEVPFHDDVTLNNLITWNSIIENGASARLHIRGRGGSPSAQQRQESPRRGGRAAPLNEFHIINDAPIHDLPDTNQPLRDEFDGSDAEALRMIATKPTNSISGSARIVHQSKMRWEAITGYNYKLQRRTPCYKNSSAQTIKVTRNGGGTRCG